MFRQQNRFSFVFALCAVIAASAASAVEVSTVEELEAELEKITAEIVLVPGEYKLNRTLVFQKKNGVSSRLSGKTSNPRDTVIYGDGTFRIIDLATGKINGAWIANLTVSNGYVEASSGTSYAAGVWLFRCCGPIKTD